MNKSPKKSATRNAVPVTAYVERDLKRKVKELARREKRTTANMVAFLIDQGVTHFLSPKV